MIRSGHRRLARSFNSCCRYTDDLTVFDNKKFLDYLKEIYPSQLTVEKANELDHLANYFQPGFMTNVIILASTLSISDSFPATYHWVLRVYSFRSS